MASCFYFGKVMHQREDPMQYRFDYHTASIKIDVDLFAQEVQDCKLLSFNRFNLLSVHTRDHGSRDGTSWREWLTGLLAEYQLPNPAKIELICYPRIMGYAFNPLAMWYAYDNNEQLFAVVAEVSNTFGQWHHYVLKVPAETAQTSKPIQCHVNKVFHVSPFIDMDAAYHFKITPPRDKFNTFIKETRQNKAFFHASQNGYMAPLDTKNILKAAGFAPFSMVKVITLIHWWALKIWLAGGQFHKTPTHLQNIRYSHSEMTLC
ncbi:DUF1365 domain-containing protein [Thiomicrospira sp. ALE5]|uniref:DUF1365 domain-containing protein n=1 Tax=Thiomicrospira sp. ALE5 TaxID=748650 RepID=UPI0008F0B914|nr:DUF1365 domain-containing protein [Thiomicrospira sp. ALE5]SFR62809.1 hypothetical protein SAMN03092900_1853 [Thiomicrospira sp. ALE5]